MTTLLISHSKAKCIFENEFQLKSDFGFVLFPSYKRKTNQNV